MFNLNSGISKDLSFKKAVAVGALLLIFGVLIYSNSFHGEFQFDDNSSIRDNPTVKIGTVGRLWAFSKTRFIPYWTFSWNYHLHRENVFGYHLANLLIHLLAAFAVYFLCRFLLQTPKLVAPEKKIPEHLIALISALIFLAHPVQTQAVTYIVQRTASLATLFYLGAVIFYLRSRLAGDKTAYIFSLFSCGLAFVSKENTFTLPFAILLLEWIGWGFSKKNIWKRMAGIAPFFLIAMTFPDFFILRMLTHGNTSSMQGAADLDPITISRKHYLLTQFRVVCTYLRLLIFPVNQMVDYDYPIARSFFAPPVLAGFSFLSSVFCSGFLLLKKQRLLAFGIFWFFLTISIESSIMPIKDVIFEHRMYLPMAGAALFLSYGIYKACGDSKTFLVSASILLLVLSGMTFSRNAIWRTEISLWADNLKKTPRKVRVYNNLGQAYGQKNRQKEALPYFKKAIEMDPNYGPVYYNMAIYYKSRGDSVREEEYYKKAIEKYPPTPSAYCNLGSLYAKRGEKIKATELFKKTLQIAPDFVLATNNLGVQCFNEGDMDKAAEYFKEVIRKDPSYIQSYFNLGLLYSRQEKWDSAVEQFRQVVKVAPNYGEAFFELGVAYFGLKRMEDAKRQLAILRQLQKDELASELERILQGLSPIKRSVPAKYFLKCESWDDKCFEQYDEGQRGAQKAITLNQEIMEIIERNKLMTR